MVSKTDQQMTAKYTFDSNVVSDLHKDAYGFRPDQQFWGSWNSADNNERQRIWDNLLISLDAELEREREAEQRAVEQFETRLSQMILSGAGDRATAIERMHCQYQTQGDLEYLCFRLNLPYNYLKTAA